MLNKFLKNDEYPPSEDTFFIANNIENEKGDYALDIGTGSGYLTKLLCKNFSFVVGTDINCDVLQNQSSYKTNNLICCNGSDAIKTKFDLSINKSIIETGRVSIKLFPDKLEKYNIEEINSSLNKIF